MGRACVHGEGNQRTNSDSGDTSKLRSPLSWGWGVAVWRCRRLTCLRGGTVPIVAVETKGAASFNVAKEPRSWFAFLVLRVLRKASALAK